MPGDETQAMPARLHVGRLHVGDAQTTVTLEGDGREPQTVPLAFGALAVYRRHFHHVPPTPGELELAIADVEDVLMPAIPRLREATSLVTTDAESVALARSSGMPAADTVELDLAAVERLFNRLVNVANGSPAAHEGLPERGTFAANLLILRELMHHAGYASVAVMSPA